MQLEQYIVIADYQKQNRSEVSVLAGDIVEVIERNENGINSFLLFFTFTESEPVKILCYSPREKNPQIYCIFHVYSKHKKN